MLHVLVQIQTRTHVNEKKEEIQIAYPLKFRNCWPVQCNTLLDYGVNVTMSSDANTAIWKDNTIVSVSMEENPKHAGKKLVEP